MEKPLTVSRGINVSVTTEKCKLSKESILSRVARKSPKSASRTQFCLAKTLKIPALFSPDFQQSIYKRTIDFFFWGGGDFYLEVPAGGPCIKPSDTQSATNLWVHKHHVLKKKKMCLQRCREVHGKRKTQEKSRFVYLAFVKVVDDFLVEPLFQLPLRRRLVPVPLGEVGRTQVL